MQSTDVTPLSLREVGPAGYLGYVPVKMQLIPAQYTSQPPFCAAIAWVTSHRSKHLLRRPYFFCLVERFILYLCICSGNSTCRTTVVAVSAQRAEYQSRPSIVVVPLQWRTDLPAGTETLARGGTGRDTPIHDTMAQQAREQGRATVLVRRCPWTPWPP